MTDTTRYLMTDHDAHAAYIQDWTLDGDGTVLDVAEVEDLDLEPHLQKVTEAPFGDTVDGAALLAAREAGYDVHELDHAGDNSDLGSAYKVGPAPPTT